MRMKRFFTRLFGDSSNFSVEGRAHDTVRPSGAFKVDQFGSLLPYLTEIDEGYFLVQGATPVEIESVGYVLEIVPQTGVTQETAKHLESIVSADLPDGTGVQFTLFASPNVSAVTECYRASRTPYQCVEESFQEQAKTLQNLAQRRADYLQAGALKALAPTSDFRCRHYRAWLAVTIPTKAGHFQSDLERLKALRLRHVAALKTDLLFGYVWTGDDLKRTLQMLTNPQAYFDCAKGLNVPFTKVEPGRPIAEQVVSAETNVRVHEDGLSFQGNKEQKTVRAIGVSVQGYPGEYALALVSRWLGTEREDYPCPFLITTNIGMPDYEKKKNWANLMAARSKQIASTELAHYLPFLKKRAEAFDIVTEEYANNGSLCYVTHQWVLFPFEGEEAEAINSAKAILKSAHLEPVTDTLMHLQSYLSALPMTMGPLMQADLKMAHRAHLLTLSDTVNMVPIVAEWTGSFPRERENTVTPLLLLTGRHGQLTPFDIFAQSGNFNAVIVGTSGSGKSALTNDLIAGNLGTNGRTYVIDVGASYKKLCHLMNGQWIEFNENVDLVLNPFDLVHDIKEDMDFLVPILEQMASPNDGLNDYLKSVLQAHILHVMGNKREADVVTVTDLVQSLRCGSPNPVEAERVHEPDGRILDLSVQLEPYTKDGAYGRYFNGRTSVNFNSNLICLELEGLKSRKDLQSVVLLCLIFRINTDLTVGDKTVRKMVVIDEAWDLLSHKHAAGFIETGYRRARKQNASFITITQSIDDYYKNPTARAALENADTRFILRQKSESVSFLEKQQKIVLTPWELQCIKGLRLAPDEYAECFLMTLDTPSCVLQIRFDDFSRLLYSSKATDVAAIEARLKQGMTLTQAIDSLVAERKKHV